MGNENTARAFWVREPGHGELRDEALAAPAAGEVRVQTLYSGISRGTETLVFHGQVPEALHASMRAPFQQGEFPAPVKYGYISVGRVEAVADGIDGQWIGRTVFSLHPHQDRYVVPLEAVTEVPSSVPARRATLAANLETAVNAVWDGGPSVGDRITIVGGGVVGLLAGWLCARIPGTEVKLIDPQPARRQVAAALGMTWFAAPSDIPGELDDLTFHASGHAEGLTTALQRLGPEGTLVELSWYGTRPVAAPLGEHFHPRRLRIIGSQVGGIPPQRRPRWSYARRLETVMALLHDPVLDLLITGESAFEELPDTLAELATPGARPETLCHVVAYTR